jgi:hypothetical protein
MELGSAQEAFYSALRRSTQTVSELKQSRRATQELPALEMDQATMALVQRLSTLGSSDEAGEILCLAEDLRFRNGAEGFSCAGIQSFWTRAGREAPPVKYTSEPLEDALDRRPVAIFMHPDAAPDNVPGYIQATLSEPHICMLLRED